MKLACPFLFDDGRGCVCGKKKIPDELVVCFSSRELAVQTVAAHGISRSVEESNGTLPRVTAILGEVEVVVNYQYFCCRLDGCTGYSNFVHAGVIFFVCCVIKIVECVEEPP